MCDYRINIYINSCKFARISNVKNVYPVQRKCLINKSGYDKYLKNIMYKVIALLDTFSYKL